MKIIAYSYSDPLLEPKPDPAIWGWEVDRIYQDLGGRFELQQLFQELKAQPADYLLIRRLEELGDSVQEVSDRITFLEAMNIEVIATEQSYSSSGLGTNLRADLLLLLQEIQRSISSRRIRTGHARNRLKAVPPPGKAPYGYRRGKDKYAIERREAPAVKDFFEQFLLYGSLRGAVRYLGKKYGKKISVSTGRRWLTNPVYRGDTAYRNGEVLLNTHGAIVSREEAAQVDRLLRRNRRLPPRTASANRSLAGLVVCACDSLMTVARVTTPNSEKEYLYLRPNSCPKRPKCRAIAYDQVLDQTIASICRDLPRAVDGMNFPQLDAVKLRLGSECDRSTELLLKLPSLVETDILDAETADLRAYKLRIEIAQLQAKLATLPPVNLRSVAQAISIPQFWLDLSESERRFYFREFIRQILLVREGTSWQLQIIFIF